MGPTPHRRARIALLIGAALVLFLRLGATGLWAPDEPRFGQVAEEMRSLEHGASGLVLLHLNGEVYTQKPPLYYWLAALFGSAHGRVDEWAARLPSALAGLACIALCVRFGTALGGRASLGIWSGAILLSVYRFGHFARRAQLDVILCAFSMLALYAYWQLHASGIASARGRPREDDVPEWRWIALLHLGLGLAALTKGPVGLLPLAVIALHLAWEGTPGRIRACCPPWSLALSLGLPLLWIAGAIALAPAGYFQEAVVDNVLGRFLTGTAHVRPFYYFFYQFPLEFLPWTLLWPAAFALAWRRARGPDAAPRERSAARLLLVWVGTLFVFFTLSSGKRGLYMLPAYPALAMLCAAALQQSLASRSVLPRGVGALLATAMTALAVAGLWIARAGGLELARFPGFRLPAHFGVLLAGLAALAVLLPLALRRLGWTLEQRVGMGVGILLAFELLVFAVAYPAFDEEKSPRGIAELAASLTPAGEPIGIFDHREMVGGVRYYSRRSVVAVAPGDGLEAFLSGGGSRIIVKARKLERLREAGPFEILGSARSGSRRLLVVRPGGAYETAPGV